MNDYPSVSVIVPTYQREDPLMQCIESVMAQDYVGPGEIIVVDQTHWYSQRIVDFFFRNRQRVKRIAQWEPGPGKARNAGAAAARNELLIFVDDDMVLPPGAVARLAGHVLPGSHCAVAGLPVSHEAPESSFADYARLYGERIRDAASGLIEHPSYIPSPFCMPTQLYRSLGGFDENLGRLSPPAYGEDDEFWQRAGRLGVKLFIDSGLRVTHRDHLAGGCGSRRTEPELARKYHMKSMAYIRLKHHGRVGAVGWLRLARGYLLNRKVLREGLRQPLQNFMTLRAAIGEVKAFMAANKVWPHARDAFTGESLRMTSLKRQEP